MFSINYSDLILDEENVPKSMLPLVEYLIKEKKQFEEKAKFAELTFSLKSFGFLIFNGTDTLEKKVMIPSNISKAEFENIIKNIINEIKPFQPWKLHSNTKFYNLIKNLYKNIDAEYITKEVFDLGNKFKKVEVGHEIYIELKKESECINIPNLKINFRK